MSKVPKQQKNDLYSPICNSTSRVTVDTIHEIKTIPYDQNYITNKHSTSIQAKYSSNYKTTNSLIDKSSIEKNTLNDSIYSSNKINNDIINNNSCGEAKELQTISSATINDDLVSLNKIKDFIKLTIEDHEEKMMNENFKFKCEMFKEFLSLKHEITASIQQHSINEILLAEIVKLKEENKRLKKLF